MAWKRKEHDVITFSNVVKFDQYVFLLVFWLAWAWRIFVVGGDRERNGREDQR
ncbi:hypothetical protein HAX54_032548, partial [Datura stramonium]|nr:hypothetical protein [Datura stramonium]